MLQVMFTRFNVLGILSLSFLLSILFLLKEYPTPEPITAWQYWVRSFTFNLIYTSVIWLGCIVIIYSLDLKLPWGSHVFLRLFIQTIFILAYATLCNFYICKFINFITHSETVSDKQLWDNMIVSWLATIIMNLLWAGIYFFRQWRISLLEAEVLKKEQLRTQYELLKNQVNPHFLFNALNTLSSLIEEDTAKASSFVENMADVYRYVLTARDYDTVSLREELQYLKAFVFMHEMRFGDNLRFDWNIDEQCLDKQVIPMSLQLLAENAIKHNEISKSNPLVVSVYTTKTAVVVENKIQKKLSVPGTGTGLQNLNQRYAGTGDGQLPVVDNNGTIFKVTIPFIQHKK